MGSQVGRFTPPVMRDPAVFSLSRQIPGTAEKGLAAKDPCSRVARLLRALDLRGAIAGVRNPGRNGGRL